MARSPQNVLGWRGPFGGLGPQGPTRTRPNGCHDCLNVETSTGEIVRRAALVGYAGPAGPELLERVLRSVPFWYGAADGAGAGLYRDPWLAVVGRYSLSGQQAVGLWIWPLGATRWEMAPVALQGESGQDGWAEYRFGLACLGRTLLLRSRPAGDPRIYYKTDDNATWLDKPLWLPAPSNVALYEVSSGNYSEGDTILYTASYGNRYSGAESPPNLSCEAARDGITIPAGHLTASVKIKLPTYGTDYGVTHVTFWRKVVGVDTQFYAIARQDYDGVGQPEFIDSGVAWVDKTAANALDVAANFQPATGNEACVWQGRLWLDEVGFGTLCYSDYLNYAAFRVEHSLAVGAGNDGNEVRRCMGTAEALFVLKHHGIAVITGNGPESYQVRPVSESVGLASDHAVCEGGGRIWFCGWDGLYALSPAGLERVSDPIAKLWQTYKTLHWRTLAYDPQRGRVLVFGWTNTAHTETLTLVYDVASKSWWRWDLGHCGAVAVQTDFHAAPRLLVQMRPGALYPDAYPNGGWALLGDDEAAEQRDFGQYPVSWMFDLGHTDGGTSYPKRLTHVGAEWARDAAAAAGELLSVGVSLEQQLAGTLSAPLTGNGYTWPAGAVGKTFGLKLSGSHSHRFRLTDITAEAAVVGQR